MSIVREAFIDGTPSAATPATATIGTWAVGDTCLVNVRWYGTQTLDSVTLTGESNLTLIGAQTGGPLNSRSQWAVLESVTGTGSKTATANLSASPTNEMCVAMWRLSGTDTAALVNTNNGASGTSAAPTVSLTTTAAGCAIFAVTTNDNGEATVGSGYTDEAIANIAWYDTAEYDIDAGGAGSKTVDFSLGGSGGWVINAIAIKAAGGAATAPDESDWQPQGVQFSPPLVSVW
jgi:hypothetical protein